jgi:hypothetical protein
MLYLLGANTAGAGANQDPHIQQGIQGPTAAMGLVRRRWISLDIVGYRLIYCVVFTRRPAYSVFIKPSLD